ncbi:hypothetical protein IWQ60_008981 [Tieghemiomyces parasiticus]|uniref:GYF domain-containing protein n=1 Tax=Tieghemiomyces parasiticus TaxID=78921 RepID=A0A9W7ZVI0_9FUNG|nr:hypothetical protein IWQ60_008981 [Tieghemiomyces parasiticus]
MPSKRGAAPQWPNATAGSSKRSRYQSAGDSDSNDDGPSDVDLELSKPRRGALRDLNASDDEDDYVDTSQWSKGGRTVYDDDQEDEEAVEDVAAYDPADQGVIDTGDGGDELDAENTLTKAEAHRIRELRKRRRQQAPKGDGKANRDPGGVEDDDGVDADAQDYAYQPQHHRNAKVLDKRPIGSADAKGKTAALDNDEDDDMFAPTGPLKTDVEDADDGDRPTRLNPSDIVGQITTSKDEYDVEGQQTIEAFNMKQDLEEGDFDAEGNYVRRARDPLAFHDQWLEDVSSQRDIQAASVAHRRQLDEAQRAERDAQEKLRHWTVERVWYTLVGLLQPRETVLRALARLGGKNDKAKAKRRWGGGSKAKAISKDGRADDQSPTEGGADDHAEEGKTRRTHDIELITQLCDLRMAEGDFQIYEMTYEQLVRELRKLDLIPDEWLPGTPLPPFPLDTPKVSTGGAGVAPPDPTATPSTTTGDLARELLADLDDDSADEDGSVLVQPTDAKSGSETLVDQWQYKYNAEPDAEVYGPFAWAQILDWQQQGYFTADTLVRRLPPPPSSAGVNVAGPAESFRPLRELL